MSSFSQQRRSHSSLCDAKIRVGCVKFEAPEWRSSRRVNSRDYYLLCEYDGDGVVQDALPEHQHVEDGVHVEGVEDGDGSYRIHGRDQRAKGKTTTRQWIIMCNGLLLSCMQYSYSPVGHGHLIDDISLRGKKRAERKLLALQTDENVQKMFDSELLEDISILTCPRK